MARQNQYRMSRNKNRSRSKRAGLVYPIGRILRYLKEENPGKRVAPSAAIYLAGIMEYLVTEILELSGKAALDNGRLRINPRHLQLAIRNDGALSHLLQDASIAGGGVLPNIERELLPMRRC